MKQIMRIVNEISGRRNRACYSILGLAIQAAVTYLPVEQSMKRICADVGSTLGKKPETISKALSRAAEDIWLYGDHQRLEEVCFRHVVEPLPAKELINRLAQYIWCTMEVA